MPRPMLKRLRHVGVLFTDDEYEPLRQEALRGTLARRLHDPSAPEKTVSEVIRDCCSTTCTTRKALRLVGMSYVRSRSLSNLNRVQRCCIAFNEIGD